MTATIETIQRSRNVIDLDPIDQEILSLTGTLPDLDLFFTSPGQPSIDGDPLEVHTIETSVESATDRTYRAHTLKGRIPAYTRAFELYGKIDGSYSGKNTVRLRTCRKYAYFVRNEETGHLRVSSSRCKLRWCPICRDVSRRIVTKAVDSWLKFQKYPKMLTFTLKHSDEELELQVDRLYRCFRKLRQRAYIKQTITGGVWFFQLKLNLETQQWHPHLHCLVGGSFISHAKIKTLWHKITGDSFVVDVRPVRDLDNVSTEVARYATSPADITRMTIDQALEVYWATKSRKICGTWGNAKGMILRPTPDDDGEDWAKVAEFSYVNVRKDFDPAVKRFWECFIKNQPYHGPKIQPDVEVYKEELDILFGRDDPPETHRDFLLRLQRHREWDSTFFENDFYDNDSPLEA